MTSFKGEIFVLQKPAQNVGVYQENLVGNINSFRTLAKTFRQVGLDILNFPDNIYIIWLFLSCVGCQKLQKHMFQYTIGLFWYSNVDYPNVLLVEQRQNCDRDNFRARIKTVSICMQKLFAVLRHIVASTFIRSLTYIRRFERPKQIATRDSCYVRM